MRLISLLAIMIVFASCNGCKEKSKNTLNKAGEIVGKAGSEFADGMKKGVEKTFANPIELSPALSAKGVQTGKFIINGSDSTTDNIVSAYLIFNEDFNQPVTIKLFSDAGQEFGRVVQLVKAVKGEARYIDFVFDKRTNIDGRGKIMVE